MKPDWEDAPWWANWLARDSDGWWCWYGNRPQKGREAWCDTGGGTAYAYDPNEGKSWTESLEERPQ